MAFSTGILKHRVTILNRKQSTTSKWGKDGSGVEWEDVGTVWAAVDFVKGMRGMYEGSIDVYSVVMVRMRWNNVINLRSRIVYQGQTYQILGETFHAVMQENTIQFNAQVLINDYQPTPAPEPEPTNNEQTQ